MHKIFVHHRSKHHAQHSGYAQLLAHVQADVIDGHQTHFPYRLAKWLADKTSATAGNYDSQSAKKEVELWKTLKANKQENSIVHYLNAERDIRYNLRFKKQFPRTKFVASFHKPPSVLKEKITNLTYLKKLDAAVCVGENQVEFIKEWLGLTQVAYIPHGVDTNFFQPDLNLEKEHCMLFVGQHLRDFESLNWILPKLLAYDKDLKVKVVGLPFALKKVNDLDNVIKLTKVNDNELRKLYQASKLLFLPLVDSTACNSMLEAMACGLPIVTNKVGGNKGYLEGTSSCFENESEVMFQAVVNLLEDNKQRELQSKVLRKKALDYNWHNVAQLIEEFHTKVSQS